MTADPLEALADLRAAVELADTRTDDGEINPDGTVSEYVLSATDWNRIVAIARGSKSEAAERAIAPWRILPSGGVPLSGESRGEPPNAQQSAKEGGNRA